MASNKAGVAQRGSVHRMVRDKGFGFIRVENGTDFFFHKSSLQGGIRWEDLSEGDPVQFVPGEGQKGPRAEQVEVL